MLNFESTLCQAKSQTEEKLLDSIFNQNLADDVAILKLRDSTKYLKNQQQMIMKELDSLNEKYFVCKRCAITEFCNEKYHSMSRYVLPEESVSSFQRSHHIQALLSQ